jgi:ATPase
MAEDKRIWRIVPDTSVIIDGRLSSRIRSGDFRGAEIIIPEAVVSELEAQANKGRQTGMKFSSNSAGFSPLLRRLNCLKKVE